MQIDKVRRLKSEAEYKIQIIIEQLMKKTKINVSDIDYSVISEVGNTAYIVSRINLKMEV